MKAQSRSRRLPLPPRSSMIKILSSFVTNSAPTWCARESREVLNKCILLSFFSFLVCRGCWSGETVLLLIPSFLFLSSSFFLYIPCEFFFVQGSGNRWRRRSSSICICHWAREIFCSLVVCPDRENVWPKPLHYPTQCIKTSEKGFYDHIQTVWNKTRR